MTLAPLRKLANSERSITTYFSHVQRNSDRVGSACAPLKHRCAKGTDDDGWDVHRISE